MDAPLVLATLNVLYEPSIAEDSPYHFFRRWPYMRSELKEADVIHLQEVHESFLPAVRDFAATGGYELAHGEYHSIRKTHLVSLVRAPLLVASAVHSIPRSHNKAVSVLVRRGEGGLCAIYNVHFPLDINAAGERQAATEAVLLSAASNKEAVVLGDWNTLPPRDGRERGAARQLAAAEASGLVVPWDHGDSPPATYWGYPFEKEETIRGYASLATLYRLFVTPGVTVSLAECRHRFIEVDGVGMALSDHMPCFARI